ncbi:hypothetical protein chiPu_0017358 [Chiloscyllium punctatum]|uniref:Uncharacterized protein n=1 Tax=Chiloscyllium punctatum TaxID=137246 RepID=A0A401RF98_CHIPU|nr:hypothetical protein [Chiloscyllium punctatum]
MVRFHLRCLIYTTFSQSALGVKVFAPFKNKLNKREKIITKHHSKKDLGQLDLINKFKVAGFLQGSSTYLSEKTILYTLQEVTCHVVVF